MASSPVPASDPFQLPITNRARTLRSRFRFHEADEWSPQHLYTRCRSDREANQRAAASARFELSAYQAASLLESVMRKTPGAMLGGAHPTGNRIFQQPPATGLSFIVGDFLVCRPESDVRFDTALTLKEDYDFTAQHLRRHGAVCRLNRLEVEAEHYTNQGRT